MRYFIAFIVFLLLNSCMTSTFSSRKMSKGWSFGSRNKTEKEVPASSEVNDTECSLIQDGVSLEFDELGINQNGLSAESSAHESKQTDKKIETTDKAYNTNYIETLSKLSKETRSVKKEFILKEKGQVDLGMIGMIFSIAGLVTLLLGVGAVFLLVGLVLGHISLNKIKNDPDYREEYVVMPLLL